MRRSEWAMSLSKLSEAFEKLGNRNGHAFPSSDFHWEGDNEEVDEAYAREKRLWEYMIASNLSSWAEKRKKNAKSACEKNADFGDLPPPGNKGVVYTGSIVDVFAETKQPARRLDQTQLRNELLKAGVDGYTVEKCFQRAQTENKPATVITVSPTMEE